MKEYINEWKDLQTDRHPIGANNKIIYKFYLMVSILNIIYCFYEVKNVYFQLPLSYLQGFHKNQVPGKLPGFEDDLTCLV